MAGCFEMLAGTRAGSNGANRPPMLGIGVVVEVMIVVVIQVRVCSAEISLPHGHSLPGRDAGYLRRRDATGLL